MKAEKGISRHTIGQLKTRKVTIFIQDDRYPSEMEGSVENKRTPISLHARNSN